MPAISIVMPVRDAEPWLGEALTSIARQSERDWELVAIDDGSTDDSRRILANHAAGDARIRIAEAEPQRRGLIASLNRGLALATAPLLARMDADDLCDARRLEAQRRMLEAMPTLFAVGCRIEAFPAGEVRDGMRRYLGWQNALVSAEAIARDRFVEAPVLHPTLMMRTSELRRLGGWLDLGWPEDWDLILRALESGLCIGKVAEPLYRWRVHARQACRTSERYSRASFGEARAHFLARHLAGVARGRSIWVLGAGPVGKELGKALAAKGVSLAGFADIDSKKIGGHVRRAARGGGPSWPVVAMADLLTQGRAVFGIAAVGQAGARARIRAWLTEAKWREGADFVVAA